MNLQINVSARVLCLHAAAKRLQIPERTLRYQASRGRIQGAFKLGKLWKFPVAALELRLPFGAGRVTGITPRHPPTPPDVRFSASGG